MYSFVDIIQTKPPISRIIQEKMSQEVVQEELLHGSVKWFNDQTGYGFIKSIVADSESRDYFVHITNLKPKINQMKPSLYTGEYVRFKVADNGTSDSGEMRLKAVDVTGAFGGPLLCDNGDVMFKTYSKIQFETPTNIDTVIGDDTN